jgi:hypothetical protein
MDWLEHEEEILANRTQELSMERPPDGYDRVWNFHFESSTMTPYERFIQEPLEVFHRDIITRYDFWNIMIYEFFKRVEKRGNVYFSGGLMKAVNWATNYILRGRYHMYWNYPVPPRRFYRRDVEDSWRRSVWSLVEGEIVNIYAGLCVKIHRQYGNEMMIEWDVFPPNIWDTLCYELLERGDSNRRVNYYRRGDDIEDIDNDIPEEEQYEPDDDVERGHIQ